MKLLTAILLFLFALSKPYSYCVTLYGIQINWSLQSTTIQMQILYPSPSPGWGAIGFNAAGTSMPGAEIIMNYGTGTSTIYDYYSSGFVQPTIYSTNQITQQSSSSSGGKLTLTFTRPYYNPNDATYYPITNTVMSVLLAMNTVATPTSPTSFQKHTWANYTNINWFTPSYCYTCFGISPTDPTVCSGNGNCTATDTCVCNTGYFGSNCNTWSCSGVLL